MVGVPEVWAQGLKLGGPWVGAKFGFLPITF